MLKDVVIHITSIQNYQQEDEDRIEFTTDGHYYYEEGAGCLSYLETEVTGLEGTRTSLIIMPEQIVVDRDGLITSRMIFKEGEKSSFLYSTPFGDATVGVDTRKVRQSMDENGGSAEIDYVLDLEHAVVSWNRFLITVKEIGEQTNG